MSLYIRAVNRSSKRLEPKGALNMYVHIYEIPEKILKQIIAELVSRNGTLVNSTQKSQERNRDQESGCLIVF